MKTHTRLYLLLAGALCVSVSACDNPVGTVADDTSPEVPRMENATTAADTGSTAARGGATFGSGS